MRPTRLLGPIVYRENRPGLRAAAWRFLGWFFGPGWTKRGVEDVLFEEKARRIVESMEEIDGVEEEQIRKAAAARWPQVSEDTRVLTVELLLGQVERRPGEEYCPDLELLNLEDDGVGLMEMEENVFVIFSSSTDMLVIVNVEED